MAEYFAVIDTETTWSNTLMSAGVIIADAKTFEAVDHKYFVIPDEVAKGGMYDSVVHIRDLDEEEVFDDDIGPAIELFLSGYDVSSIYAYNAGFDKGFLPFLKDYGWYDIMKIAAYKQFNSAIPETAECCSSGRLKRGYGVEPILRILGKEDYHEIHNALFDALDELDIMRRLGHPIDIYPTA